LDGTVVDGTPHSPGSIALISIEGRPAEAFMLGQEVMSGTVLQTVHGEGIVLTRGDQLESLPLREADGAAILAVAEAGQDVQTEHVPNQGTNAIEPRHPNVKPPGQGSTGETTSGAGKPAIGFFDTAATGTALSRMGSPALAFFRHSALKHILCKQVPPVRACCKSYRRAPGPAPSSENAHQGLAPARSAPEPGVPSGGCVWATIIHLARTLSRCFPDNQRVAAWRPGRLKGAGRDCRFFDPEQGMPWGLQLS
jgi:hypothetical protein